MSPLAAVTSIGLGAVDGVGTGCGEGDGVGLGDGVGVAGDVVTIAAGATVDVDAAFLEDPALAIPPISSSSTTTAIAMLGLGCRRARTTHGQKTFMHFPRVAEHVQTDPIHPDCPSCFVMVAEWFGRARHHPPHPSRDRTNEEGVGVPGV
jgi:hypothetical protein